MHHGKPGVIRYNTVSEQKTHCSGVVIEVGVRREVRGPKIYGTYLILNKAFAQKKGRGGEYQGEKPRSQVLYHFHVRL